MEGVFFIGIMCKSAAILVINDWKRMQQTFHIHSDSTLQKSISITTTVIRFFSFNKM